LAISTICRTETGASVSGWRTSRSIPSSARRACASRWRAPGEYVLADADRLGERQLLEHRGDSQHLRMARRSDRHRLAAQQDVASVRLHHAGEDIGQRRFAGAVLADERVHLTSRQVERDAVEGDRGAEALDEVAGREQGVRHHVPVRLAGGRSAAAMSVTPAE
jgi:hypothetical protein